MQRPADGPGARGAVHGALGGAAEHSAAHAARGDFDRALELVPVDEQTQADFLSRYYLLMLASGMIERVYWWRLVARGYGLMEPRPDGSLRPRPGHRAVTMLERLIERGITPDALVQRILEITPIREDELTADPRFQKMFAS